MVGRLSVRAERGPKVCLERVELRGIRVLEAAVSCPPGLSGRRLTRRLDRAAEALRRAGVRRVLSPPEEDWWPILRQRGLIGVDPEPFCQALAGRLALGELRRQGRPAREATVALAGKRVSRAMARVAEELCPAVRRLVILAPQGGDELRSYLRDEFGMPIVEDPAATALPVTLAFSPGAEIGAGTVLKLWGPVPQLSGLELQPPDGECPLDLLTLLWECGRLSAADISVVFRS